MIPQRVTVIFHNETITVDDVEKRIPLRLPMLLKLKRLDWYPASLSGLLVLNDDRAINFIDADVIAPFLSRWQDEPPQPDVTHLKRYVDEITVDPDDTMNLSARRRWSEIERRHREPVDPRALLQLLSSRLAFARQDGDNRERSREVLSSLLKRQSPANNLQLKTSGVGGQSALAVREAERRRLQKLAIEKLER